MKKVSFLIPLALLLAAMIHLAMYIIPTLDYFGKYVFYGLFNLFVPYGFYQTYGFLSKKSEWFASAILSVIAGIFLIGTFQI